MATVYLAHDLKHDRDVTISGQGARTFDGALRRRYRAGRHVSTTGLFPISSLCATPSFAQLRYSSLLSSLLSTLLSTLLLPMRNPRH